MNVLGTHILLDLKDCDREILDDQPLVKEALVSTANEAGAKTLGESFHKLHPRSVTGVPPISESHLSVHTAAVDVFTRSKSIDADRVVDHLVARFKSRNPAVTKLDRGVLAPNKVEAAD